MVQNGEHPRRAQLNVAQLRWNGLEQFAHRLGPIFEPDLLERGANDEDLGGSRFTTQNEARQKASLCWVDTKQRERGGQPARVPIRPVSRRHFVQSITNQSDIGGELP